MRRLERGESVWPGRVSALCVCVCVCDKARHGNSDSTRSVSDVCCLSPVGTEEGIVLGDLDETKRLKCLCTLRFLNSRNQLSCEFN